ncbi:MAG: hypothetical protein GXP08_14995 [Gammaproteobacteria bacterium]|nr:hypothetical protein [Gammaproteobacteria bacterium]
MSRKRKKAGKSSIRHRSTQVKKPTPELSPEILEQQIPGLLDAAKYREAVNVCKNLLKFEQRQEWLDFLARAYEGRAHGLADKGMFKEAIAI